MAHLDDIPEKSEDELLGMLYNSAKTDNFTPEELLKYTTDMTTEQDIRNQIAYSREEGREEGISIGLEKTARRMLKDGMSSDLVCKYTGLTLEKVNGLRK